MHLLVTGQRGTLGQVFTRVAEAAGHRVTGWDRHAASPLDRERHAEWIARIAPDAIIHLAIAAHPTGADNEGWRVNVEWSLSLAQVAQQRGIPLVFTSTALVFDNSVSGPFTLASPANAQEGYGFEKRTAEHGVLLRHPEGARVVRLGWQIGPDTQGNNMIAHAAREMAQHGRIAASTCWQPACSQIEDTAAALLRAVAAPPGLYMADSNHAGHCFADILAAIAQRDGHAWTIAPNEDYRYDQRLVDRRLGLPDLAERLPALRK